MFPVTSQKARAGLGEPAGYVLWYYTASDMIALAARVIITLPACLVYSIGDRDYRSDTRQFRKMTSNLVKGTNWAEEELTALLLMWAEAEVQADLNGITRNKPIFDKLADRLVRECKFPRGPDSHAGTRLIVSSPFTQQSQTYVTNTISNHHIY